MLALGCRPRASPRGDEHLRDSRMCRRPERRRRTARPAWGTPHNRRAPRHRPGSCCDRGCRRLRMSPSGTRKTSPCGVSDLGNVTIRPATPEPAWKVVESSPAAAARSSYWRRRRRWRLQGLSRAAVAPELHPSRSGAAIAGRRTRRLAAAHLLRLPSKPAAPRTALGLTL